MRRTCWKQEHSGYRKALFYTIGSDNTFEAAPAVLGQKGYTTAVFHGNVGSFGIETMCIKLRISILLIGHIFQKMTKC